MPQDPDNNVIIATRFSRLKGGRVDGEPASNADVGYEALAALSEAMELLGDALNACSAGAPWDFERNERLEKRLEELLQCLEGGEPSVGAAAQARLGAAVESTAPAGAEPARTIRD